MKEGRRVYKELGFIEFRELLDYFNEIEQVFQSVGGDGQSIVKGIIQDDYTSSQLLDTLYRNNLTICVRKQDENL